MLCRTANELFWMARHIERAENTARLLDVTYRTSLLPYHIQEPGLAWAEPWSVAVPGRHGFPGLGQDALAPVPGRDVRDHAARRGLSLHPAGHAHRARR